MNRIYLCIDLKSFYASVECVARELDPLTTNLVVADKERTDKTICLAVTPSLKAYGISGRARLFEVVQRVEEINRYRRSKAPGRKLDGESYDDPELKRNPSLALSYIVAPPRMSYYMETSARIYDVYLKFIAPEDIHVYSIDEVFIDLTPYLKTYQKTPREMAEMLIKEVLTTTGITATAGIGTNMYLAKVAMDITAKKMPADENGVRIAELDEMSYRRELWTHRPLTDFWMVGRGISKKLEDNYMFTMGDVARCSQYNEAKLYKLFGVNAELLIDRAWGREPTTIADVKAYRPSSNSLSMGQVRISRLDYGKKYCTESITVDEQALQRAIVRALNRFNVEDEATYLLLMKSTIGEAVGINGSSDEIDLLERRIDALNKRMLDLVSLSVQEGDDAENHEDDFKNISTQIEQLTKRITAIRESESENGDFQARLKEIQDIIDKRRENKDIYDDSIVRQMVECIKVYHDGRLQIILGGGYELEEYLEK